MSAECVGFSEIDKYAIQVYKKHFNHRNFGDISKINWSKVPDFDLLAGGSPCQDLSIAGKRAGLNGARSGLFREFMRAIKEKKPKNFIWENVKGALSSNRGWDFAVVLNEMAEAGYSLWWQVLNSKDFGVPQNRERIFVVGFRDQSAPEVFFERESNGWCVQACENKQAKWKGFRSRNISSCVNTRFGSTARGQQFIKESLGIRRLTPKECERLQGLPDDWTKYGLEEDYKFEHKGGYEDEQYFGYPVENNKIIEISDTQRYKMCGNAVTVNVVKEIALKLLT